MPAGRLTHASQPPDTSHDPVRPTPSTRPGDGDGLPEPDRRRAPADPAQARRCCATGTRRRRASASSSMRSRMLMAYEATRDLPLEPIEIETPLERMTAYVVSGKKLILVPILRAGLGMVEAMLRPHARRPRRTHRPLPRSRHARSRSSTTSRSPRTRRPGTSSSSTRCSPPAAPPSPPSSSLKERGAARDPPRLLVAAPEGVRSTARPTTPTCQSTPRRSTASSTSTATSCPGLGDAGDRLFGTR